MQIPAPYTSINAYNAHRIPSTIHARDNNLFRFFQKYFLQRAQSVFEIGLPEEWSRTLFLSTVFIGGFGGVVNTDKFGRIFNPCGLSGIDINYQPTNCLFTNPLIRQALKPRIGVDCEIIKLQPNYSGVMDIVDNYANVCAMTLEAIQMNLVNSKIAYMAEAPDKKTAEEYKKAFDAVQDGNPAVFLRKGGDLNEDRSLKLFLPNVGGNYIADALQLTLRKFEQDFDRWIGIPTANTEKRERLTDDEVNIGGIETRACVDLWHDTLSESFRKVRDMFGYSEEELYVKFRYNADTTSEEEGGSDNDTFDSGTVLI